MNFFKKLLGSFSLEVDRKGNPANTSEMSQLSEAETEVVGKFQKLFNIQFDHPALLVTALKHRSYLNTSNEPRICSNERLEFLGDAVLDLVVTHFLYQKFPNKTEGHLSKVKSILVSKPVLADISENFALGNLILMNQGEEKTGGRHRKSILADAFEAIIGAIYLDKGLQAAADFIETYLLRNFTKIIRKGMYRNFKSILLEYAQGRGEGVPEYRVVKEIGPDHAKEFIIQVWVGKEMMGEGRGRSKKLAEQKAAKQAVRKLDLAEPV